VTLGEKTRKDRSQRSASRAPAGTLAGVSEARIAGESDHAARAKPSASSRVGSIGFFVALWAVLVAAYALCVIGLAGRDALSAVDPRFGILPTFRFNTIYAALIAFIATALRIEHRAIPRDFGTLRGLVAADDAEWERWRAQLFDTSRSSLAAWIAIGVALGQVVNLLGWKIGTRFPETWPGHYVFMNGFATILFALMAVLGAFSLRRSRVFLEMGRRARVHLLAPEEHAPFARTGLRASAYWFLGSSIASLLTLDEGAWEIVVAVIAVTLALGFVSLLLPSRGVHERLRAAKLEELARVRAEIERARAALIDTRDAGAEIARMPALLAWEARVERVSVWPFDAPTLVRFALFLLVPLGSWLGGALVERAVDSVLR